MARLKTAVDQQRAAADNSILVDAGDQFQGTLYYKLFKADLTADLMNALDYDAMAIGNHEFDDGPSMLETLADNVNFPILGTNLDVHAEPTLNGKLSQTTIVTLNGEKIGLIGLTTPETESLARPGPNVVFADPVASAQAAVAALQAQGVNKIVALTHLGYSEDIALAEAVDGIDVIIGGHSHTFVYDPATPIAFSNPTYPKYNQLTPAGPAPTVVHSPNDGLVLVTTAFCWNAFLGKLNVTFDDTGKVTTYAGNPIYLANNIVKDPTVAGLLAPYDQAVAELRAVIIGNTTVEMPVFNGETQLCRVGECLLGDLVTNAMLWKINNVETPGKRASTGPYQIALINGGALRAPLSGQISVGGVLEVLPFGNTIATFEITGAHLSEALESGLSRFMADSGSGRFPQVAGIHYTFSPQRPAGERLISVEVYDGSGYAPLDRTQIYRVVSIDYLRSGGDGYTILRDHAIHPYDFGPPLDEAVQDYVKMLGTINTQNLVSGRIFLSYRYYYPFIAIGAWSPSSNLHIR
jgi:5'-nucleotidase